MPVRFLFSCRLFFPVIFFTGYLLFGYLLFGYLLFGYSLLLYASTGPFSFFPKISFNTKRHPTVSAMPITRLIIGF